jgi:hypothetical protein
MLDTYPGVVVNACNPSTWGAGQENHEFEATLGYIVTPYLKKKKLST